MLEREDIIAKVKSFIDEILATGVPLDRVILFGSHAKQIADKDSDIDVALVAPIFSGFGFEDRRYFSKINIKKQYIEIETK